MIDTLHLPQLSEVRRWPALSSRITLALGAVLFAVVFALRVSDPNVNDAAGALFIVPIIVLSLRFGLRGALAGSLAALSLVLLWARLVPGVQLLTTGYVVRAVTLLAVALMLGTFVERRRGLEASILRYYDTSLDLLATGSVHGRLTRVNPAWQRTLGHAPETLYAKQFLEFVHPEDREATVTEMHRLAKGGETVGFRNRVLAADGSYRWLEWSAATEAPDGVVH